MYHFVLWTLLPIPQMKAKGRRALESYALLTAAGLALYYGALITFAPAQFNDALIFVLGQFYLWSYIHITASFALSAAHPRWIREIFALPAKPSAN